MGNCGLGSSEAFKDGVGSMQQGSYELHVLCRAPEDNVNAVIAYLHQQGDTKRCVSKAVNTKDQMGFTPLLCAVAANNYGILRHLIGCGASVDVTVTNKVMSTTSIIMATLGGNKDILSMLLKELATLSTNPLGPAAGSVGVGASSSLADTLLNFKDDSGRNALAYAVESISPKNDHAVAIIKQLIGSGISLDGVDGRGNTALSTCLLSYISKEETRRLKQQPHSKNSKLTARLEVYKEVMFLLLEAGASCNIVFEGGKSALILAAEAGLFDVCCKMVACGGDVCAVSSSCGKCSLDYFSIEQTQALREAAPCRLAGQQS